MTNKEIIEKAKTARALTQRRLRDPRVRRVLGFFVAKKLLIVPGIPPRPRVKLKHEDVLYVARHVEPRVAELWTKARARRPRASAH